MVPMNTENYWILTNSYKLQGNSYKLSKSSGRYKN